jgi:hypothetical protein
MLAKLPKLGDVMQQDVVRPITHSVVVKYALDVAYCLVQLALIEIPAFVQALLKLLEVADRVVIALPLMAVIKAPGRYFIQVSQSGVNGTPVFRIVAVFLGGGDSR